MPSYVCSYRSPFHNTGIPGGIREANAWGHHTYEVCGGPPPMLRPPMYSPSSGALLRARDPHFEDQGCNKRLRCDQVEDRNLVGAAHVPGLQLFQNIFSRVSLYKIAAIFNYSNLLKVHIRKSHHSNRKTKFCFTDDTGIPILFHIAGNTS